MQRTAKQERWVVRNMHAYGPAVSIGVVASFTFVAGQAKRARRCVQRLGLEWFYRLCRQSKRLRKRYPVIGGRSFRFGCAI